VRKKLSKVACIIILIVLLFNGSYSYSQVVEQTSIDSVSYTALGFGILGTGSVLGVSIAHFSRGIAIDVGAGLPNFGIGIKRFTKNNFSTINPFVGIAASYTYIKEADTSVLYIPIGLVRIKNKSYFTFDIGPGMALKKYHFITNDKLTIYGNLKFGFAGLKKR